ncbi:MAG: hypothetical protein M3144_10870 [Actinomycetota bacterium]|nr:hypothetical protein [Actinomycetota bacterium]
MITFRALLRLGAPGPAVAFERQLARTVLPALIAVTFVLLVPGSARAAPGLPADPGPLDSRISLPTGAGVATEVVTAPVIGLESRSFPFGRLDVALLVLGSLALTCLAAGALRVLWYGPVPVGAEGTSAPAVPVGVGGDTGTPRWAPGVGPG